MNALILSKADFAEALADCEVGKPKSLTLTVTPVSVTDDLVVAEPTAAEYTPGEEVEEAEEAPAEAPSGAYKPRSKGMMA